MNANSEMIFRAAKAAEHPAILRLIWSQQSAAVNDIVLAESLAAIKTEPTSQRLWGAFRGDIAVAGVWVSIHPGGVASLWPPGKSVGEPDGTIIELLRQTLADALPAEVQLTQCLLELAMATRGDWLRSASFAYTTDLMYLSCPQLAMSREMPDGPLQFESMMNETAANQQRLLAIVEQTYTGTRDCPQLNGLRSAADCLASYRAIGSFDAANWFLVRHENRDVGCLLLSEHPADHNLEIIYMGIVPEARGKNFGEALVRQAQATARKLGCERLVLAVDAANEPALSIYRRAGFEPWDRRQVYLCWRRT